VFRFRYDCGIDKGEIDVFDVGAILHNTIDVINMLDD
jgi:hypothetical protein